MAKKKRELTKLAELVSEETGRYKSTCWFDKLKPEQQAEILAYKESCGSKEPCWSALARAITDTYGEPVRSDSVSRWWRK